MSLHPVRARATIATLATLATLTWKAAFCAGLGLASGCGRGAKQRPTPPEIYSPPVTRIAFGSCAQQNLRQPIWDVVNARKPDIFIFMGDNIYADGTSMALKRAAYAKLGRVPGFQQLRASKTRILATWDDHDYGYNDVGADYRAREESQKLFLDFFEEPPNSARRGRPGVYAAYHFGPHDKRLQIILLDLRYFRSEFLRDRPHPKLGAVYPSDPDPSKTLLGETQWAWLEDRLREPADLRLVVSSIQLLPVDHTGERWDAFPRERLRFFELVKKTGARGVVILSGDRHYAEFSRADNLVDYPLYEFTSSGLNSTWEYGAAHSKNRFRLGQTHPVHNVGLLEIFWADTETRVWARILNARDEVLLEQGITLDELREREN